MIRDKRTEFADQLALNFGAAGNYAIGDAIDNGLDGINDISQLFCVILISTTVLSAGAATVQFKLVSSTAPVPLFDANTIEHYASAAIPKATLVAKYRFAAFELPKGQYNRYLSIAQVTGVAALTAGTVTAFLTPDVQTFKAFADAVN
jgi:hypothetical protein